MKKVLIFMLVLGMASAANALVYLDLNLTVSGSDTINVGASPVTVQLKGNQDIRVMNNIDFGSIGTNVFSAGAWVVSYDPLVTEPGVLTANLIDNAKLGCAAANVAGTVLYEITLTPGEIGVITMADLQDIPNPNWDFMQPPEDAIYTISNLNGLNIIPEPMTIVLLGLGGLFLRRRK